MNSTKTVFMEHSYPVLMEGLDTTNKESVYMFLSETVGICVYGSGKNKVGTYNGYLQPVYSSKHWKKFEGEITLQN